MPLLLSRLIPTRENIAHGRWSLAVRSFLLFPSPFSISLAPSWVSDRPTGPPDLPADGEAEAPALPAAEAAVLLAAAPRRAPDVRPRRADPPRARRVLVPERLRRLLQGERSELDLEEERGEVVWPRCSKASVRFRTRREMHYFSGQVWLRIRLTRL